MALPSIWLFAASLNFAFNIGLGCEGNSSCRSGATMHEESSWPAEKREDEVCHLIMRYEKDGLQTMHRSRRVIFLTSGCIMNLY